MGFSTDYENINDNFDILPEGDYEVIIRNIEERTTKNGATGLRACSVSFQKKEKVVKYNKIKPRKRAKR